jgi:subtilisin
MHLRKNSVLLVGLLLGIFLATGQSMAGKTSNPDSLTYPLYPGKKLGLAVTGNPAALHKVFVGFTGTPGASEEALVRGLGGRIKHTYWLVPAIAATIPEAAIEKLMKNPLVTHIEEDIKVYAIAQTVPWGVSRVNAPAVHTSGNRGTGVKVAVIDSGIDYTHPDLSDNYRGGYDFVNNDGYPMDDNSHGTHVAGTIAASDNAEGVVGVAPEADLYALKVLDASGSGDYSDVVAALEWCVINEMQVTNNSYGSTEYPGDTVKSAFDDAYSRGILHVAAAGNSGNFRGTGDNVIYPARWDSLIAVAATDSNDKRASFSSTGPAVELAAPGVSIYSTLPGGGYGTKSGTSMACPHVAGAAALVISEALYNSISLSPGEVRNILNSTAVDLGTASRDSLYGYGRVDAAAAVAAVPRATGTISGTVTDNSTNLSIQGATVEAGGKSDTTNEQGNYSLILPPGTYTVTASANGYESTSTEVSVTSGNISNVDFSLSDAITDPSGMTVSGISYATEGKGRHLLVTVWVVDGSEYPVSGATVSIDLYLDNTMRSSSSGTTGSNGGVTFKYPNAPSGTYSTEVTSVTHSNYTWDEIYPENSFSK